MFIPDIVDTNLLLNIPLFSTSILSTFLLGINVENLCVPAPLPDIGITPVPANASEVLLANCISCSLMKLTKYDALSISLPGVVPIPIASVLFVL